MFVPAGAGGRSLWFNKDCTWAAEEYGLVGLLVGLAVYSGVILDVPLPLVMFRKVLRQTLTLEVIRQRGAGRGAGGGGDGVESGSGVGLGGLDWVG